jgi:hypothetical protein
MKQAVSLAESPVPCVVGAVASLHIHPEESGEALLNVSSLQLVAGKGIAEEARFFGRINNKTGQPNRRQVTLIEREQIAEHAAALGLKSIPPGEVRSNIETTGIDLQALLGREVEIGETRLFCYEARRPCAKMDAVCPGLRELMQNDHQGVLAEVRRSGTVRLGDAIRASNER